MFGLSFMEISVILIVALIFLGPKKLPELAKSLGKGIREFRSATEDFKSTIDQEISAPDSKRELPTPKAPAGPTASADEVEAEVVPAPAAEAKTEEVDSATPSPPESVAGSEEAAPETKPADAIVNAPAPVAEAKPSIVQEVDPAKKDVRETT